MNVNQDDQLILSLGFAFLAVTLLKITLNILSKRSLIKTLTKSDETDLIIFKEYGGNIKGLVRMIKEDHHKVADKSFFIRFSETETNKIKSISYRTRNSIGSIGISKSETFNNLRELSRFVPKV